MIGQGKANAVPFIKVLNTNPKIEIVGNVDSADFQWTEYIREGPPETAVNVTYFYKDSRCIGVVLYNYSGIGREVQSAIVSGNMPDARDLTSGRAKFFSILKQS